METTHFRVLKNRITCDCRHCQYPQTIVMQLAMKSKLEKIQILCHSVYIRKYLIIVFKLQKCVATLQHNMKLRAKKGFCIICFIVSFIS